MLANKIPHTFWSWSQIMDVSLT